jgi:hypothetical protein
MSGLTSIPSHAHALGALTASVPGGQPVRAGGATAWLDPSDAPNGTLHVGSHNAPSRIDRIEEEFIAALCVRAHEPP